MNVWTVNAILYSFCRSLSIYCFKYGGGEVLQSLNIFVLLVFIATLCSIFLVLYAIKQRFAEKSYFLIFLSFTNFMYNFGYLLEIRSLNLEAAFSSVRIQYMGLPFILPICFLFVRDIYEQKRFNNLGLLLTFTIPILSMLGMQLYPLTKIFYTNIEYIYNIYIANCRIYPGALYHVYTLYSYLLFFLIIRLIIRSLRLKPNTKLKKQHGYTLLAACLIPMISSIPYVISTAKLRYDPTPIANTISMGLLLFSVRYHNLLSVVPLARAQVIESMEDALIVCDKDFNFLDANQAAKHLFPALKTMMPGDIIGFIEKLKNTSNLCIKVDSKERFYKSTQTYILQNAAISGICILLHDVTENENLLKKLKVQASFDPLMNIYNRRTFFEIARMILDNPDSKSMSYALLMIDIDFFKKVNDTYGHLSGDYILKKVAIIVTSNFRKDTDIAGRYGGEEIVVLLKDISVERAFTSAEDLRNTIENTPFIFQNNTINITVSIGVSHSPVGEINSFESLLNQADIAMYKAKNNGRNQTIM